MPKAAKDQDTERAARRHAPLTMAPVRPQARAHLGHESSSGNGKAHNATYGVNYGVINQSTTIQRNDQIDLTSLLNPILDASHTRNLRVSPPNSKCFPKTRERVIAMVLAWARSPLLPNTPHIMWIYGYAGCGKSAIAQVVAEHLAEQNLLGASFFFFRGSGDRSRVTRFANTIAHQVAAAIPSVEPIINDVVRKNPGLRSTSTSSTSKQFEQLIYQPIFCVAPDLRQGAVTVVLDGLDECEDHEDIAAFVEDMIAFLDKNPLIPLRFLITSRVEDHIHRELHSSPQVQLLNLVDNTSDADIRAALDVSIEKEMRGRVLACDYNWLDSGTKERLIIRIGKSFIFMTTILKDLFNPQASDGLTPRERLPRILSMNPDFDGLYRGMLEPYQDFPSFLDIISIIARGKVPLSIVQIANILHIQPVNVVNVLVKLHAVMQVPDDGFTPVTLWHTSLRDFLCSTNRAGPFLTNHRAIASGSYEYAQRNAIYHLDEFAKDMEEAVNPFHALGTIATYLHDPIFSGQTALEVASCNMNWCLVRTLVRGGVNVNTPFQRFFNGCRVALHVACLYDKGFLIEFLLEKGADPNIGVPPLNGFTGWRRYSFPLMWAVGKGKFDLVTRLLDCGANPNLARNSFGESALHVSALGNTYDTTRILLEYGADPNIKNSQQWTPLYSAYYRGATQIMECLLQYDADPNIRDGHGRTPLLYACALGDPAVREMLLEFKADPTIRDHNGNTPLHSASFWCDTETVECLLTQHNVDPNIRNNLGKTALQLTRGAGRASTPNIVEMLLRCGAIE